MAATARTERLAVSSFSEDRLLQMGKVLHEELSKSLLKGMTDAESAIALRVGRAVAQDYDRKFLVQDDAREQLAATIRSEVSAQIQQVREMLLTGLDQIRLLVQALPVPQVINQIPESRPPDVHFDPVVNVSPTPYEIRLPDVLSPEVVVNVPEQQSVVHVAAPNVNVAVPEQQPPTVSVNVPAIKTSRKFIQYDDMNRPAIITTEEDHG